MAHTFERILYAVAGSLLTFILSFITLRSQVLNSKADWADVKEMNRETIEYVDKQDAHIRDGIENRLKRIEGQNDELIQLIIKYSNKNK